MIVIDAKDKILGRLATRVAKLALLGNTIRVINCEHAIITGKKKDIITKYTDRMQRGIPSRGPFFPKQTDRIVRRTIRGMLPYKQSKGRDAYERVLCYVGEPKEFAETQRVELDNTHISTSKATSYMKLKDVAPLLGGSR